MGVSCLLSHEQSFLDFRGVEQNRSSFQGFGHFCHILTKKYHIALHPRFLPFQRKYGYSQSEYSFGKPTNSSSSTRLVPQKDQKANYNTFDVSLDQS